MKKRAGQMPVNDVVAYCVSYIKSMQIGGKRPRYLLDLHFSQDTEICAKPQEWHAQLDNFIEEH